MRWRGWRWPTKRGRWEEGKRDKRWKMWWSNRNKEKWGRKEGERGRGGPLISTERQKWMNPIGRRASCSLLSPRLGELQTHFIEICEIGEASYRLIYHRPTSAHRSFRLHNKIRNWHFSASPSRSNNLGLRSSSFEMLLEYCECLWEGGTNPDWSSNRLGRGPNRLFNAAACWKGIDGRMLCTSHGRAQRSIHRIWSD